MEPLNGALSRLALYIPAILSILFMGVVSIVLVEYLRPTQDNTPMITIIVGMLTPTLVSILTLLQSKDNQLNIAETRLKVEETHGLVNSRLTELVEQTRTAAEAVGEARGIIQQQALYAERTRISLEAEKEKKQDTAIAAAAVLKTAADAASKKEEL